MHDETADKVFSLVKDLDVLLTERAASRLLMNLLTECIPVTLETLTTEFNTGQVVELRNRLLLRSLIERAHLHKLSTRSLIVLFRLSSNYRNSIPDWEKYYQLARAQVIENGGNPDRSFVGI